MKVILYNYTEDEYIDRDYVFIDNEQGFQAMMSEKVGKMIIDVFREGSDRKSKSISIDFPTDITEEEVLRLAWDYIHQGKIFTAKIYGSCGYEHGVHLEMIDWDETQSLEI